ncbi:hypothetical protein ACFM35_14015 [Microbacterium sp. P01]|uniref:hypothetical protein n=1 Tax=Microbacterium sp. P01 TaxID=3366261 RepID=UPI00367264B7
MTLTALRDDALAATADGFALRLGLPWIRSLPIASLAGLHVEIDGDTVTPLQVDVNGRQVEASALADEAAWWFLQDRLIVRGDRGVGAGAHRVIVSFDLVIPYLQIRPDGPLTLPFRIERTLVTDAAPAAPLSPVIDPHTGAPVLAPRGSARDDTTPPDLPAAWSLTASAFNWTPEVILAERAATDIAAGIIADGIAEAIEVEPGQLWRSFPEPDAAEVEALRETLEALGGRVSIVGASLDDWLPGSRRRDEEERLAFLVPQLKDARRMGALGVRLPIGQAGEPLLRKVRPLLHDLDLVLFEEIQGQQTPGSASAGVAIDTIGLIDDPHIRLLVDVSMLMPSVPESYLEQLQRGGVALELITRLRNEWRDPATVEAIVDLLRSGGVPPQIHTLYMDMLVRFGRSDATVLRSILPLVGAFHLKFWDLDDADGRVSEPIRDLGALLAPTAFAGTLTSEWGGHEWLDADPSEMTRAHLALARGALAAGSRPLA